MNKLLVEVVLITQEGRKVCSIYATSICYFWNCHAVRQFDKLITAAFGTSVSSKTRSRGIEVWQFLTCAQELLITQKAHLVVRQRMVGPLKHPTPPLQPRRSSFVGFSVMTQLRFVHQWRFIILCIVIICCYLTFLLRILQTVVVESTRAVEQGIQQIAIRKYNNSEWRND